MEIVGAPVVQSATVILVKYKIKPKVSPGTQITLTVDNNNGSVGDTYLITTTNTVPSITSLSLSTHAEGEETTGSLYGDNLFKWDSSINGYAVNIAEVTFGTDVVSFTATRSGSVATPFAGVLSMSDIDIDPNSAGTTKNLVIKTAVTGTQKTATTPVLVSSYLPPQITGVRIYSGTTQVSALVRGQPGYKIELEGQNFPVSTGSILIGGAASTGSISTPKSRTKITITGVNIPINPTNTNVEISIGSDGNSSASLVKFIPTVVNPSVPTISGVETFDVVSPTDVATIVIYGANLTAITHVDLLVTSGSYMIALPAMYSVLGMSTSYTSIIDRSDFVLSVQAGIGSFLGTASASVRCYGSSGSLIAQTSPFSIGNSPVISGFTGSPPAISTIAEDNVNALFTFDDGVYAAQIVSINLTTLVETNVPGATFSVSGNDITVDYVNPLINTFLEIRFRTVKGDSARFGYVVTASI
jgi:hypothetical protein